MNTLSKTILMVLLALGAAIGGSFATTSTATAGDEAPSAAKADASRGAIGCADARSVMQAYLYRDSTLEAMTAALDANDDRWQKSNDAFMKAQREAFASGEDGPTDEQWKAVELARLGLAEVHEAVSDAFDKVLPKELIGPQEKHRSVLNISRFEPALDDMPFPKPKTRCMTFQMMSHHQISYINCCSKLLAAVGLEVGA
jgi:hypothetical protein